MPAETNGTTTGSASSEPDFAQVSEMYSPLAHHESSQQAQAFQDLARGERTASALENHLDALERKIEELLAKADADEKKLKEGAKEQPGDDSSGSDSNDKTGTSN